MAQCLKPNFNKDQHSGSVRIPKFNKNETLEEYLLKVQSKLREVSSFSLDFTSSDDPDNYTQSIKDLSNYIIEEIGKLEDLPIELTRAVRSDIRNFIKSLFLPTDTDVNIIEVLKDITLVDESERQDMRFEETIKSIYGTSKSMLDMTRLDTFQHEITKLLIIDPANRKITWGNKSINLAILLYMESQYNIIKKYVDTLGFDTSLYPNNLFKKGVGIDGYTINPKYTNALLMFYNYIQSLKDGNGSSKPKLVDLLEEDWILYIRGKLGSGLYEAVNAYINLLYLDLALAKSFKGYIKIDRNLDTPISPDASGNKLKYKYVLLSGNVNMGKHFDTDDKFRDALNEMGSFTKTLISIIPIYQYVQSSNSGYVAYGYLQPKLFINTFTFLRSLAPKLQESYPNLAKALYKLQENPKNLETVFKLIFKKDNKNILSTLSKLGFDSNYVNFLYSVYQVVYNGKNSWKSIEDEFLATYGFLDRYNTVDCITSAITSNIVLSYLQTTFNFDANNFVTDIKNRYGLNSYKFDILNNINETTIDNDDKKSILLKYKLSRNNDNSYTIKLGDCEFTIRSNSDILYKRDFESTGVTISNLDELRSLTLDSSLKQRLLNGTDLSETESQFRLILGFIDDMLFTNFSKDLSGLLELEVFLKLYPNGLRELITSATRALVITDIYDKFSDAVDEKGNRYSKTQLKLFLADKKVYPRDFTKMDEKFLKTYFLDRYDGPLLITVAKHASWVEHLAKVRAIISGDTIRSVVSDLSGNKLPNNSPSFLGGNIHQLLVEALEKNVASGALYFADKPNLILEICANTDVRLADGSVKLIKTASEGELIYDAIFNKFFIPYLDHNIVYTLPTTYSDKTKFILYGIQLDKKYFPSFTSNTFDSEMELKMISTIGLYYKQAYNKILDDYSKLFSDVNVIAALNGVIIDGGDIGQVNKLFKNLNRELLLLLVDIYNETHTDKLEFEDNTHYREAGKGLAINELLYEFANNLYTPAKLHARLEEEKLQFAQDLLSKRVAFQMSTSATNPINKMAHQILGGDVDNWVDNSYLAIGAIIKEDGTRLLISYGKIPKLKSGERFLLNPIFNAYFMMDNFIGNNLRYSLTGSEINHTVKTFKSINLAEGKKLPLATIEQYSDWKQGEPLSFYDLDTAIKRIEAAFLGEVDQTLILLYNILKKHYDDNIYKLENLAQNAQFKRNVIIPGTIRPYTQYCKNGIPKSMKIAVIDDIKAPVYNTDGDDKPLDAHDGSALINPFWSILENGSLQNDEVGAIKKPIHHFFSHDTGTATLLKYAVDTITNTWMRNAENNEGNDGENAAKGIRLHNVFKRMTNLKWSEMGLNINLVGPNHFKDGRHTDFSKDIMQGDELFYRDGVDHYRIEKFGIENGVYWTLEYKVNGVSGSKIGEAVKYYHYFENDQHEKSTTLVEGKQTIDSLYHLHTVLGGIYSESKGSDGRLQYSEASNKAVTKFIINTTEELPDGTIIQPLKDAMIAMVANKSAVKNGVKNLNSREAWTNDSKLRYMTVSTLYYGILLDADHIADESTMTEFSLVISALDAGGRVHNYISLIYRALGKVALEASAIELDAIDEFRKTGDLSKIYDVVGRIVIDNIKRNQQGAGLAEAIINSIEAQFNINLNHADDAMKIPFSDKNIYNQVLSSFVSTINKKSIKRRFPGTGTPLVPGYNISMIYELNGTKYQFEDLLKKASLVGITSDKTEVRERNLDRVRQYLQLQQEKYEQEADMSEESLSTSFMVPADNYIILWTDDQGVIHRKHISLNSISDYYSCTSNIFEYLQNKGFIQLGNLGVPVGIDINSFRYYRDLTKPRNLKPFEFTFDYKDNTGKIRHLNLFSHWKVKGFILGKTALDALLKKDMKKAGSDLKQQKLAKQKYSNELTKLHNQYNVQEALDELAQGLYIEGNHRYMITNVKSKSAECIMSNIYKSLFGIKDGDTLQDVLSDPNYFKNLLKKTITSVESENFDIVFTKANGLHQYITFKPFRKNDDTSNFNYVRWDNTVKKKFEYIDGVKEPSADEPRVLHKVYAAKDNIPLFEIGREITRPDLTYDPTTELFIFVKDEKDHKIGDAAPNQGNYKLLNGTVVEYVEFISQYTVSETKGNKRVKFRTYNINRAVLANRERNIFPAREYTTEELQGTTADKIFALEVDKFVGKLLGDIYKSKDHTGVLVNQKMTNASKLILLFAFHEFTRLMESNLVLYNYLLNDIVPLLNSGKLDKEGNVSFNANKLQSALIKYVNNLSAIQRTSFLKSLMFTAARIPAQTLQSFMQMENVGFTGANTNQCFVSHFQTWLQGSDYDIDKAYMMGLAFNSVGIYTGWSNLFNYKSKELIDLSEYLPMPSGKNYIKSVFGVNIDSFIQKISEAKDILKVIGNKYNVTINHTLITLNITDPSTGKTIEKTGDRYDIILNDDPTQSFRLETNFNGEENEYNIHFRTGSFDQATQRRVPGVLSEALKLRLFNATMLILPINAILSLDPTTEELITSGIGGLTSGSIAGYNSIFENASRRSGIEFKAYLDPYEVQYYDINGVLLGPVAITKYRKTYDSNYRHNVLETERLELAEYCNLLNYLEENEAVARDPILDNDYRINYTDPLGAEILHKLRLHEKTKIPENLKQDAIKNFISSHIQNTILHIRNFIGANSPISMDDARAASELSPKGLLSAKMTLFNPATKLLMQYLNITGKNVIGIAANGEKASFMWHYYLNDILRNGSIDDLKHALFGNGGFKTSKILNRSEGNPQLSTVTTLPELNFEGVHVNLRKDFTLGPTIGMAYRPLTVDLTISQILSAATDNAKELILSKINAGNKLAKMYLFLITLGYNLDDIVAFMTSPVVSFIDTITEPNIFTGLNISMKTAVKLAKGKYKDAVFAILGRRVYNALTKNEENKKKIEAFDFTGLDLSNLEKNKDLLYEAYRKIHICKEIKALQDYEINLDALEDVLEFQNVLEGADEFSALGTMLGLNQGIKTSKVELLEQLDKFSRQYNSKRTPPLDVPKFLNDEAYRKQIIDDYDSVKVCLNPYAIITKIPQFKAILDLLSMVVDTDKNISIKSRIFEKVSDYLKERDYQTDDTANLRILSAIDNILISNFLRLSDIKVAIPDQAMIMGSNRIAVKSPQSTIDFNGITDAASFKYLFENTLIPRLKKGKYYVIRGENQLIVEMSNSALINNEFVKALFKGNDHQVPLYQVDLNMLALENNATNKEKFQKYLKGLSELLKIPIGNKHNLADLFVLYNLIVNKNSYGLNKLTTLFDKAIQNLSSLSLIKDYLKFVGNVDFYGQLDGNYDGIKFKYQGEEIKTTILDVLVGAAPIVKNLNLNLLAPVVLYLDGSTYKYYDGKSRLELVNYKPIPLVEGETTDEYLARFHNNIAFFVLGGDHQEAVETRMDRISKLNEESMETLWDMMREGLFIINKIC